MTRAIHVDDLGGAVEKYRFTGYRLDMIFPADDPREARMSRGRESISLCVENHRRDRPLLLDEGSSEQWIRGRAGMEYRDIIPDRLGGRVIASHIRLTQGGPVPDYVHYHKIVFQVIYCWKGRIEVVYEDQGEHFWLEPGDLVLQPPEIRHRVLECEAGSEVIEITSPAEHETWVEHKLTLPNGVVDTERLFGRLRFFKHTAGVDDARDGFENSLVELAVGLAAAPGQPQADEIATTFSQSLSQA